MSDRTLREVARAAVAAASPDELADFDDIARAFAADPSAALRGRRGRNEPMANAYACATEFVGAVLLAVATDLSKEVILAGGQRGLAGFRRWLPQRRTVDLDDELPAVSEKDVPELRKRMAKILRKHRVEPDRADQLVDALVRAWPRRT